MSYNPASWYWIVAGSMTAVYSSAAVGYVPVTDPTYVAWLAQDNRPTRIAVESDLWDLLALAGVDIPAGAAPSNEGREAQVGRLDRVTFRILFNHENRIRALAGQPAVTAAQFRTAIKALL